MKKYNICLDDQITSTDHWIKSDIAPPMFVFPKGGRILDSVYLAKPSIGNNRKQLPLSETFHSYISEKTLHHDHHDLSLIHI